MNVVDELPPPLATMWNWQLSAACRGMNAEAFFHSPGDPRRTRRARVEAAKAICASCPVRRPCLDHALEVREPYGIWGGLSEDERAKKLGLRSLQYPATIKPSR